MGRSVNSIQASCIPCISFSEKKQVHLNQKSLTSLKTTLKTTHLRVDSFECEAISSCVLID